MDDTYRVKGLVGYFAIIRFMGLHRCGIAQHSLVALRVIRVDRTA